MKLTKIHFLLLLAVALTASPMLHAQKDLQISKVFEQYGKKKDVVMVELTNEVLGNYNFTLFKSITIRNDPAAAKLIRECLSKDGAGAKKIKQVVANGVTTSIYLQLPRKDKDNRLILFNDSQQKGNQLMLIYIETKSDTEDVLKLLLKKK
jgi:hypothetical protein